MQGIDLKFNGFKALYFLQVSEIFYNVKGL